LSSPPVEQKAPSVEKETPKETDDDIQVLKIKKVPKRKEKEKKKKRAFTPVIQEATEDKRQKEDHCKLCASCTNQHSRKCAPFVKCKIEGTETEAIVDTGAQITVFKRTRKDLPVAKLRMKSATAHKATLYGPKVTQIEINGKSYPYPVYEADVAENLIGYDFMDHYDARIRIRAKCLELGPVDKVPFRVDKSITKGQYGDGSLYYIVRANTRMLLRPMMHKELQTYVETDMKADELEEASAWLTHEETAATTNQGVGRVQSTPNRHPDVEVLQSSVELNTERNEQDIHAPGSHVGNQPREELKQVPRIGLFANNKFSEQKTTKLPSSVLVHSGIVPCISAPVTVSLVNFGDKCVDIPKYAIVGEVFLVHPLPYSGYDLKDEFDEDYSEEGEESEAEVCSCGVAWTEHE